MNIHELWGLHVRKENLLVFYWFFEKFLGIWVLLYHYERRATRLSNLVPHFVGEFSPFKHFLVLIKWLKTMQKNNQV